MLARKGFTLIELMVVILIVAILAAVAIPIMRGRIDSAKWTEGKAMAGTIATALRAFAAEHGADYGSAPGTPDGYGLDKPGLDEMGFILPGDLTGTYFNPSNYTYTTTYLMPQNELQFTIRVTAGLGITKPTWWQLDHTGQWTNSEGAGGPPGP
ncbi:MAG: type IV pilin protein [Planctomycetota bacterium]|jgi:general secretion pathway protein G